MKKYYILLAMVIMVIHLHGQTSMGMILGGVLEDTHPKGQALDNSFFFGMTLKKYATPTINLVSGVHYRFYDATVSNLPSQNDLVTYYKDAHPDEFFHISPGEYFRFNYLVVPAGVEVKLTTFLRIAYHLESNFLLGANSTVKEFLEHERKSVAPVMFTSNVSVLLHGGNAFGIGFHATLHPRFLRNDIDYSYAYMTEFNDEFRSSYLLGFSIWGDFTYKKRKKI